MQAQVIDYEIDPSFDTGSYFQKGSVNEITETAQEEFIIGGSFFAFPGYAHGTTVIGFNGEIIYDGSTQDFGPHNIQPYLSEYITLGPLLVFRNQFGNTINSFQFEFQKPEYSGFVSSDANDVMVYQDTLLLVAGVYFTDSADLTANSLRQLCLIDSTGEPIEDFPMVKCEPFDARIYTIDTLSTGAYIIAGSFTHVNGHPTNNIAKLNSDFSVDTEFENVLEDQGTAFAQLIDSQDRIWLIAVNGSLADFPSIHPSIFRILPNGLHDTEFTIPEILLDYDGDLLNSYSSTVVEDEDGRFIVAGFFNKYNGVDKNGLVKIEDNGGLIEDAFGGMGTDEAVWGTYSEYAGITTIKQLPDGNLLLGGRFSSFGGESYSCLVRLQANGFVGLDENKGRGKLKLYPNPAQNTVRFETPDKNQRVEQVEIFDLSGRLVKVQNLQGKQLAIDVSALHRGVYLVKARTADRVYSQTLVLEP